MNVAVVNQTIGTGKEEIGQVLGAVLLNLVATAN